MSPRRRIGPDSPEIFRLPDEPPRDMGLRMVSVAAGVALTAAVAVSTLVQGTGEFAKLYSQNMNAIVIQVARAEPTKGSVEELGVESWNDDGSANVVVAARTSTKMPDGKVIEAGNRWLVTAKEEGEQWKISNLLQVI